MTPKPFLTVKVGDNGRPIFNKALNAAHVTDLLGRHSSMDDLVVDERWSLERARASIIEALDNYDSAGEDALLATMLWVACRDGRDDDGEREKVIRHGGATLAFELQYRPGLVFTLYYADDFPLSLMAKLFKLFVKLETLRRSWRNNMVGP